MGEDNRDLENKEMGVNCSTTIIIANPYAVDFGVGAILSLLDKITHSIVTTPLCGRCNSPRFTDKDTGTEV